MPFADSINHENVDVNYKYVFPEDRAEPKEESAPRAGDAEEDCASSGCDTDNESVVE